LAGCNALVTGAASGIGAAAARRFVAEGASVWLADIDDAGGEAMARSLRETGHAARFIHLDVTQDGDWSSAVAALRDAEGGLDILVNNAGTTFLRSLAETSLEDFRRVMRINTESVFAGLAAATPLLAARGGRRPGGASVVNVASMLGRKALAGNLAYGASKAAVLHVGKCAALEFARAGLPIRVNNVLPAMIETPLITREIEAWARHGALDPQAARDELARRIPVGRLGQAAEVADAILYLASSESSFTTGIDLPVCGGRSAE
jgi:NAD(P)-dependent dehydrogenase (short-subunit alcohol dehydrogenase family)